ncbi:MAG: TM0106 family RecB-like putative nuclease [Candidatus Rokuibacteriota bacterium]|nr:MAG: TM0106 family RecB-like putative nuclease [Candidatus Rokubacteria bacterium]
MQALDGRLILSPSDLNDHVECAHLTTLALEVARGARPRPHVPEDHVDLLRRKGEEHEAAHLAALRAQGKQVVDVIGADRWDFEGSARATLEAMRAGAEVIYQATFVLGDWRGRADFLERVEQPTALGAWGYEALDAKLARAEKPTYVLQLCFYSEAIAAIQKATPVAMHVLLGIGERRRLRHADFAAYYRRVRSGFLAALGRAAPTEPYPVDHCALCEFREVCDERWRREDHLVLVAGIKRDQVTRLRASGIGTLAELATAAAETKVADLAARTYDTLHDQAGLQLHRRTTGALTWHALSTEPEKGFERLPRPSAGDVVFDIEGDPFWEPARGLHFLFGLLTKNDASAGDDAAWGYRTIWAHDRDGERRAFEALIDFFHERLARDPDMHVYHYGAYEPTALTQLMSVYATREEAVDELLRRETFVDLHTVVRQGLRAGVEGYSLKDVEALAAFRRQAHLKSGTRAVLAYEQWIATRQDARLKEIEAYNDEDCRATLALRDWLVTQRPDGATWAERPATREVDDAQQARDVEREALRQALVAGAEVGSPRWLVGELLEYHRREARPAWWWFFARCGMSLDELVDDAEAIGRLEAAGPPRTVKRSLHYPFRFPPQQHKLGPGDSPIDPATGKSAGTIEKLDDATGTLVLRRGPKVAAGAPPAALIPGGPYDTREQREALARLAASARADDGRYRALQDIVARARPRLAGGFAGPIQTTDPRKVRERAAALDGSYLFIQGPPGTGKTWTGARLVVDLIRRGRRVGVTANSHKVIHNLLDEIERAAGEEGVTVRGIKKCSAGNAESEYESESGAVVNVGDVGDLVAAAPRAHLLAGTAWLFAHHALDGLLDTLLIDEAGQVALADALAMGTAARNVILLGDPQQLAQVSQGTHPEGTGVSVLEHLLGDRPTVPAEMGILLEQTRRMHPRVCRFISEVVYEDRLTCLAGVERQDTAFGTGVRFLPVEHAGNAVAAPEEAGRIAQEIRAMRGASWTNAKGKTAPLGASDFMVVAPYNAQVRCLRRALEGAGLGDVPVGTVDKFQGREAAVVFYSMATSSAEDVPRSLDFLFSRNRLNVAVSRAMCLACVVASPRLLESRARTIEQMRLINALCRFVELAEAQAARTGPVP